MDAFVWFSNEFSVLVDRSIKKWPYAKDVVSHSRPGNSWRDLNILNYTTLMKQVQFSVKNTKPLISSCISNISKKFFNCRFLHEVCQKLLSALYYLHAEQTQEKQFRFAQQLKVTGRLNRKIFFQILVWSSRFWSVVNKLLFVSPPMAQPIKWRPFRTSFCCPVKVSLFKVFARVECTVLH